MRKSRDPYWLVHVRRRRPQRFDAACMLVYTLLVYVWALGVYPLGRDFAHLADQGSSMPFLARELFALEVTLFDTFTPGYLAVNVALLFACMICLYKLTNRALRGPMWLGTLSATLFMAHPVHAEAVLNLCGFADLVPALAGLLSLSLYAEHAHRPRLGKALICAALFALASMGYRENAYLFVVVLLYTWLVLASERRPSILAVTITVIGVVSMCVHRSDLFTFSPNAATLFAPLYFLFYPLGYLPETARTFHEHAWTGWLAAAGTLIVLAIVCLRARSRIIVFGVLAIVALRLVPSLRSVDPVHLVGGGQLVLENALFNVGLVALFNRIMDAPKWRAAVVGGTSILCMAFFAMQVQVNLRWTYAGQAVRSFQEQVDGLPVDEAAGVLPDYQYFKGAPMQLSESVRFDTPFSRARSVQPLLPMHYEPRDSLAVSVDHWERARGRIRFEGARALDLAPWPYALTRAGDTVVGEGVSAKLTEGNDADFTIEISPHDGMALPERTVPVSLRIEE
jgi:hypothetical protein